MNTINRNKAKRFLALCNGRQEPVLVNRDSRSALKAFIGLVNAEVTEEPSVFEEALQHFTGKRSLPTTLDTEQLGKNIHAVAFTSAQVNQANQLDSIGEDIRNQLASSGNPAQTRVAFQRVLRETGYVPPEGKEGTIQDLRTFQRQNLIINTNLATARGYGQMVRQNDPDTVDDYPALELVGVGWRKHHRGDPWYKPGTDGSYDWPTRWQDALDEVGTDAEREAFADSGRMVALKSSEIWQALGDGAGGYEDTLGNPYPPFAWESSFRTENVELADAIELGLLGDKDDPEPADLPDLGEMFRMNADFGDDIISDLVSSAVRGIATIIGGVLKLT